MEPFKNLYNKKSISILSDEISKHSSIKRKEFEKDCLKNINNLEMKERVIQIADSIHIHLKGTYKSKVKILLRSLKNKKNEGLEGFILWPYTQYIETHGLEDFETSLKALYEITQRFTAEFGIRAFLEKDPDHVYRAFNLWVKDPNEHVRRWVSEGTRPNLPWGKKISHMKKKLPKNLKLLEQLKEDPSEYVRKSVANHMNDISWMDPKLTLKTLRKWQRVKTKEMEWITNRSLRSLLKQGHPEALDLIGFSSKAKHKVSKLKLSKSKIKEGESFDLSFTLKNLEDDTKAFMVDYTIYYPKANGSLSPKTFKLKKINLLTKETQNISKKISFKKVTTRKHYPGKHLIELQVNGQVQEKTYFHLV